MPPAAATNMRRFFAPHWWSRGLKAACSVKIRPPQNPAGSLLDRVIRRSYVSLSTEPWHGTRRLLSPPAPEELDGIDVVHLHTVADWFDVPALVGDAAPQNRRRYQRPRHVACDWRLLSLPWMRSLRQRDTSLRSLSNLEMACKPVPGKDCAFAEVAGISELWSTHGRKQPVAGRNRRAKSNSQSLRVECE